MPRQDEIHVMVNLDREVAAKADQGESENSLFLYDI